MIGKLHKNDGITILWALLLVVVMTVVGSIVLTYGSANLSRIKAQKQTAQDAATLTSAAALMREQVTKGNGETYIFWSEDAQDYDPSLEPDPGNDEITQNEALHGVLLMAYSKAYNDAHHISDTADTATISAGGMDDVTVTAASVALASEVLDLNGDVIDGEAVDEHAMTYVQLQFTVPSGAAMYLELQLDVKSEPDGMFLYTVTDSIINGGHG